MINYNEINDFIIKVFNYYNGRINVINKAILDINWCNLNMCNAGGFSRLPNIVIINPMVILRFHEYNEYISKVQIIETIIHELYHTDQLINYNLYISDINFNRFIEHSCELETSIYIAGHRQEIYNIFGIDVNIDKNQYNKIINYWYYPGIEYRRRYFYDHVFMCIDNLCGLGADSGSNVYNLICLTIKDQCSVIININGELIPVYTNGIPMSIDDFNKTMIKYNCTGEYTPNFDIDIDDNENLLISIKIHPMNLMCKKV